MKYFVALYTNASWSFLHFKSLCAWPWISALIRLSCPAGAYGTVFKAQRDGVQEVAVKIFHNVADARQQKGIMREVAILRSCK